MMKKILPLLFLVNCQLSTVNCFAQTLTLDECIGKALEYNKSLSSAKMKLEQTTFDMKSYKANFYPQINLLAFDFYSTARGEFTIEGGHLPIYSLDASGKYVPNVTVHDDGSYTLNQYADFPSQSMNWKLKNIFVGSVSLMEPIYAGGKISTAYEMSKLGVNMAQENIRLTESEVVVKTYEAYYLAVKAKELGEVARSYMTLLDELKKNVEGAFRHGMSTRNDIMKVQVKQNEAKLSIQKADNGYRLALMNLCHIIGLPLASEVEVAGDGEATAFSYLPVPLEMGVRPEHVILDNKTELARQNVKLTKSDYLPNVALGASYAYSNGGELAGKKLLDKGSASVGVVVKMPLDLFGGSTNKVRSAKAAYQIAQMEQQDLDEQMQLEWAKSKNLYDEAQTELSLCQTALEQAAENMRLSKQQYEVGFETLADYLETQAHWQQCNANLVNARCQLQLAYVQLKKASGTLLPTLNSQH